MKNSNLILGVLFIFSTLTVTANTNINSIEGKNAVSSKIVNYLSTINFTHDIETVTIFSDFLINENGDLYNVDFMVNEIGEILILTTEIEEEFYKVNSYSSMHLEQYSFPVAYVRAEK